MDLEIEWATLIFQIHFFPLLKVQLHHSHFSLSSSLTWIQAQHSFFFFFFFAFFFFGFWIQLQVTHLALSSSFGLKHRLFMNYARLVHILCSIWPYENGLIKKFKHKDQCSIYNASPSCFEKFLFLWKTCLNLYLKWVMTFRSPHHFFSFLFLFFFFFEEKSDQVLSQHIKIFYLSHYKSHLECSLSTPMRALPLVSKCLIHFYLSFSNGPCPLF